MTQKLNVLKAIIDQLPIPTMEGYEMIALKDVVYLEANNTYTIFHFMDKSKVMSTKNIGYYEEELFNEPFIRVHQSFMVNLNSVKSYVKADNGYILMKGGEVIQVSRGKKEALLTFFRMRRITNSLPNQPLAGPKS